MIQSKIIFYLEMIFNALYNFMMGNEIEHRVDFNDHITHHDNDMIFNSFIHFGENDTPNLQGVVSQHFELSSSYY